MFADAPTPVVPAGMIASLRTSTKVETELMNKQLIVGSIAGAVAVTALAAVGGYRMMDKGNYAEVAAFTSTTSA